MMNFIVLVFALLFSFNASAWDIKDIFGESSPHVGSLTEKKVLLDELTFEVDADGTWSTCTDPDVNPCTTIKGRAPIKNFAALRPSFGINRIQTQKLTGPLPGESGPNGEPVYGAVNDKLGQIRFVGGWRVMNNTYGQYVDHPTSTNDYFEVTFWGTGLNLLSVTTGADFNKYVNAGSSTNYTLAGSAILGGRNYASNMPINLFSGLSEGWHTVRVENNGAGQLAISGFEILNESTDIKIPPGSAVINGKKVTTTTTQSLAYDSCTGTVGGHAVAYLNKDGTVGSVCTASGTPAYMGSVDFSNSEIIRKYYWREFGASRTDQDDFSLLTMTGDDRAFTLDDGTTTLVGDNVSGHTNGYLFGTTQDKGITLTFVGTGVAFRFSGTGDTTYSVFIDGVDRGTTDNSIVGWHGLASDLPYGTHTVSILRDAGGSGTQLLYDLAIYGPKKPSIPADAFELGEYFMMADFDGTAATGTAVGDWNQMPIGVMTKGNSREAVYVGTWTVGGSIQPNVLTGIDIYTGTNTSYVEYTFIGSGVSVLAGASAAGTWTSTILIDGSPSASGTVRANMTNDGGGDYSSTSTSFGAPVRVEFTGLTFGKHTIKLEKKSGTGNMGLWAFHAITPTHIHKQNGPHVVQNTLAVGSQSLMDTREFGEQVKSTPVTAATAMVSGNFDLDGSGGSVNEPLPDNLITVKLDKAGPVNIYSNFTGWLTAGAPGYTNQKIFMNGAELPPYCIVYQTANTNEQSNNCHTLENLAPGVYTFQTRSYANSGDTVRHGSRRSLQLFELSN